ncbi:hypothetical protein SRHO_G00145420 [Serrasalmus rhombeus]
MLQLGLSFFFPYIPKISGSGMYVIHYCYNHIKEHILTSLLIILCPKLNDFEVFLGQHAVCSCQYSGTKLKQEYNEHKPLNNVQYFEGHMNVPSTLKKAQLLLKFIPIKHCCVMPFLYKFMPVPDNINKIKQ